MKILFVSLLCFLSFTNFAQSTVRCSSLWEAGFPDQAHSEAGDCVRWNTTPPISGDLDFYIQSVVSADADVHTRMGWAADAIMRTWEVLRGISGLTPTRVVWSATSNRRAASRFHNNAMAYPIYHTRTTEPCPIIIYPDAMGLAEQDFKQMIAHETYHCMQGRDFPEILRALGEGGNHSGDFWKEGIAQFMSNHVYPTADYEYNPGFGHFDSSSPFFNQTSPHLSDVFFQSYYWFKAGNALNVHAIQYLYRHMSGGSSAAEFAMNIPDIQEALHDFGMRIGYRELYDSSERLSPRRAKSPVVTQISEETHSSYNIRFLDFAIIPQEFKLPKGGKYTFRLENLPENVYVSHREKGGHWNRHSFMTEVETTCSEDKVYEVLLTRASHEMIDQAITVVVDRMDKLECNCNIEERPRDRCLNGQWEMDNQSMIDYYSVISAGHITPIGVEGKILANFDMDGSHFWDFQNHVYKASIPNGGVMVSTSNGRDQKRYSSRFNSSERWMCQEGLGHTVTIETVATIHGRTMRLPGQYQTLYPVSTGQYHCDENEFWYDVNTGPGMVRFRFKRL